MNMEQDQPGTPQDATAEFQYKEPPSTPDPLAAKWKKRIDHARKHWDKFHQRVKHNRKVVAGFDWTKNPDSGEFYSHRANLIHGTITAVLPNIYARNPEISVTAYHKGRDLKLLCHTIERVTNRQLHSAKLKKRAKASVRAALTCSFGVMKVMYQRNLKEDPFIKGRIQDTQDNIARIEALLLTIDDPQACAEQEAAKAELAQTLEGLNENAEVVAGEGLVIDRVLTEHILLDPSVTEFDDYVDADWIAQIIPMKRSTAEGIYGYKLNKAKAYKAPGEGAETGSGRLYGGSAASEEDGQICIVEIWDKQSNRILTTAEGLDFWLKDPFTPERVGERWYPFFLVPFQLVDGQVVAPSLVDLTEKLQDEHNRTRDKENRHRDAIKPGWIGDRGTLSQEDVERLRDAAMNEITLVDANGKPINNAVMPKTYAALDPALYDTSKVRYDWEQVTGLQDAARSTVVKPKTATEATIQNQALSGRTSEFRDQIEDVLEEMSQYSAQILLQELTPEQVERIMGPHKMGSMQRPKVDPMTGQPMAGPDGKPIMEDVLDPQTRQPVPVIVEPAYDWPQLSREEVFDLVQMQIRAGTTGEPDKLEQQEVWLKMLPVIQPLITQIIDFQLKGIDTTALVALLKETVARFDEKLDIEQITPKLKPLPPPMPAPGPAPQLQAVA